MRLAERRCGELAVAAGDRVEQVDDRVDVRAEREARADRLLRVLHQAVGRVEVELEDVGDVGRDAAAREPGNVRQGIDEAGEVGEVGERRRPV